MANSGLDAFSLNVRTHTFSSEPTNAQFVKHNNLLQERMEEEPQTPVAFSSLEIQEANEIGERHERVPLNLRALTTLAGSPRDSVASVHRSVGMEDSRTTLEKLRTTLFALRKQLALIYALSIAIGVVTIVISYFVSYAPVSDNAWSMHWLSSVPHSDDYAAILWVPLTSVGSTPFIGIGRPFLVRFGSRIAAIIAFSGPGTALSINMRANILLAVILIARAFALFAMARGATMNIWAMKVVRHRVSKLLGSRLNHLVVSCLLAACLGDLPTYSSMALGLLTNTPVLDFVAAFNIGLLHHAVTGIKIGNRCWGHVYHDVKGERHTGLFIPFHPDHHGGGPMQPTAGGGHVPPVYTTYPPPHHSYGGGSHNSDEPSHGPSHGPSSHGRRLAGHEDGSLDDVARFNPMCYAQNKMAYIQILEDRRNEWSKCTAMAPENGVMFYVTSVFAVLFSSFLIYRAWSFFESGDDGGDGGDGLEQRGNRSRSGSDNSDAAIGTVLFDNAAAASTSPGRGEDVLIIESNHTWNAAKEHALLTLLSDCQQQTQAAPTPAVGRELV